MRGREMDVGHRRVDMVMTEQRLQAIIAWPDHSDDPLSDSVAIQPVSALTSC